MAQVKASFLARLRQIMLGYGVLALIDFLYDYPLYTFTLYKLGDVNGGIVMTLGSMLYCLAALRIYEWLGTDWLGVNVLEHIKEKYASWLEVIEDRGPIVRWISYIPSTICGGFLWLLKKNDICAFFILCIVSEPFKTTVFLRHGRFDGLRRRDYIILFLAVLVSNGYWIFWTSGVVWAIKMVVGDQG